VAPGNRLNALGDLRIRYDEWGNMVEMSDGRVTTRFAYSLLEHLDSITRDGAAVAKYEYDLLLRRTRKITADDDVRFCYHANLLSTLISSRHGRWDFLYVPDLFIPLSQAGPGGRFYYSFDQIGTPTELWDENGKLVATISSEAFGTRRRLERDGSFDGPIPFHFAGQYADDESGLHYNLLRYYWPAGVRFISQDPSGLTAGLNLYTYPLNPMNWIDPLGLAPVAIKISCKPKVGNFTPCEQKALMMKVAAMDAQLQAQPRKQRCTSCRKKKAKQNRYFKRKCKGTVPKGYQVDHVQELQLGGADKCCKNLMAIPARPNGSAGAQIHAWLEAHPNAVVGGISLANPACNRAHECKSNPTRRGTGKAGKGCEDKKPIVC
jgi:RHS repeat-associated protein